VALPLTRNETATPASPVKSGTTNDIQDCIIGGKHGDVEEAIPGCFLNSNGNTTYSTVNGSISTTGAANIVGPIPLKVGDRIKSLTFSRAGDGVADITSADVILFDPATGTALSLGSTTVTNPGAAADTTINVTDTTIVGNRSVFLLLAVNAANIVIHNVRWTKDHP
jgi:hypothetical protein